MTKLWRSTIMPYVKSLIFSLFFLMSSCGPLPHKVYSSPGSQLQELTQKTSRIARLNTFIFNEETHDCRNADGTIGYNYRELGPCSFISDPKQLENKTPLDLRGSIFYYFTLKTGTDFKNYHLEDTVWVSVTGTEINFKDAQKDRARFIECKFKLNESNKIP